MRIKKAMKKGADKIMDAQNPLFNSKEYYDARNQYDRSRLGKLPLKSRKRLFPILKAIITIRNKFNGYKIRCIGNKSVDCKMPKIYAITHIGKLDIETVVKYIKEHFVLLSGDFYYQEILRIYTDRQKELFC